MKFLLPVIFLTSCFGPNPSPDDMSEPGRIQTIRATIEDASDVLGYFDTRLGLNCTFRRLSAYDDVRCYPYMSSWSIWYGDPNCMTRLYGYPSACTDSAPSPFVTAPGACGDGPTVFERGDEVFPTSLYYMSGSECVLYPAAPDSGTIFFIEGPVVSLEIFARAEVTIE